MTTFADARAEAIAGLTTAGVRAIADPDAGVPYVLVSADGGDAAHLLRGAVTQDYRFVLVGGGWEVAGSAREVDTLMQAVVTWLRGAAGWRINSIGREGGRSWAGSTYLTADVSASRTIDIS